VLFQDNKNQSQDAHWSPENRKPSECRAAVVSITRIRRIGPKAQRIKAADDEGCCFLVGLRSAREGRTPCRSCRLATCARITRIQRQRLDNRIAVPVRLSHRADVLLCLKFPNQLVHCESQNCVNLLAKFRFI